MTFNDVKTVTAPALKALVGRSWSDIPQAKQLAIYNAMCSGQTAEQAVAAAYQPAPAPAEPVPTSIAVTLSHDTDMTIARKVISQSDLSSMTPDELYALSMTAQSLIRAKRKSDYRLEQNTLTGIIRDSFTAAYAGETFSATSIIGKHVPAKHVKAVAQRSVGNKRKRRILSQLSQHEAVTLTKDYQGKAGLNAMLNGSVSQAVNEIARQVPMLKRLREVELAASKIDVIQQELAELRQRVSVLESVQSGIGQHTAMRQASSTPSVRSVVDATLTSEVLRLKADGKSIRQIEASTGINRGKVHRILKENAAA